jgi:hypothetical protein
MKLEGKAEVRYWCDNPRLATELGWASMRALAVIGNPSVESFSHAMAEAAIEVLRARHYDVQRHDLYAERFDPVQPTGEADNRRSNNQLVEMHCRDLARPIRSNPGLPSQLVGSTPGHR